VSARELITRIVAGIAVVASLGVAGCTTNNYNCNVKDACRVPGAAPER
jgi:hypothetical protein